MKYIISLSQDSIPDYEKYKDIFSKKFNEMGFKNDHVYGWTLESNDYDDDSKSGNKIFCSKYKNTLYL